ncbi:MAG TPA: fasciclin domain-containing protein [Novosphingobium sp.]|nr:fasciclin domain-containing protein [Novosphingobium sp.]
MRQSMLAISLAASLALALGACSKPNDAPAGTATAEGSSGSLTAALDQAGGMKTIGTALTATGLAAIFDGKGSYTVIAPNDAAFAKLGEAGAGLMEPEQRSALAAVLRDHIVPGELTAADIGRAIDASDDKRVKMRTMGAGDLTFSKSGRGIQVAASDGTTAMLIGPEVRSKGSVAIPADGVLKKI